MNLIFMPIILEFLSYTLVMQIWQMKQCRIKYTHFIYDSLTQAVGLMSVTPSLSMKEKRLRIFKTKRFSFNGTDGVYIRCQFFVIYFNSVLIRQQRYTPHNICIYAKGSTLYSVVFSGLGNTAKRSFYLRHFPHWSYKYYHITLLRDIDRLVWLPMHVCRVRRNLHEGRSN